MIFEKIKFYDPNVSLSCYIHEISEEMPYKKRPAVVICPGGGYMFCSDREADVVAMQFVAAGFHSFVFRYSLEEKARFPQPLIELCIAMKTIRENAEKWGVETDKIAVGGFSAGGHLTASLGTLWNNPKIIEKSQCFKEENKPNALILGYAATTMSWSTNAENIERLIGPKDEADFEERVALFDTVRNIGKHTPPSFLFHTFADPVVPTSDSLKFAAELDKNNIPYDLHVFSSGGHGLSIGTEMSDIDDERWSCVDDDWAKWTEMCCSWLWRLFGRKDKKPFGESEPRAQH